MSKARDLANLISGGFTEADVPALSASKITSGTFADARLSASSVTQHVDLTSLSADNLTSGTVPSARLSLSASDVPDLATSKITSGTFADARLSASSVTQHVDLTALSASNLTSGTIPDARYGTPTFNGSNITNLSTSTTTGTWTPTFSSGSFTSASAVYQKVGKFVFCQMEAFCTSNPNISGSAADNHWYMGGLPFTAISYSLGGSSWLVGMGTLYSANSVMSIPGSGSLYVDDNTTTFSVHGDQGWRATTYRNQSGYGGIRNYDMRSTERPNANESWIYVKLFYTSAS